jgi:hypothetical protein
VVGIIWTWDDEARKAVDDRSKKIAWLTDFVQTWLPRDFPMMAKMRRVDPYRTTG